MTAKYLDYIRSQPCLCFAPPPSEPHHVKLLKGGGMALKPTDYHCIPVCRDCHENIHRAGEARYFGEVYILNSIIRFLTNYLENL